jgi:phosphoserine phosphatase RsbU/P
MARVLLAADAEPLSNRVVAQLALEAAGHTVQVVHDGYDALAVAETTHPDALVLDSALGGLDGFQVLDRLRRRPLLRQLPVVMLSGIARDVVGELAHSLGAVRFLARPFTNDDLAEAVDAALATRPPAAEPAAAPGPVGWRPRAAGALHGHQAPEANGA